MRVPLLHAHPVAESFTGALHRQMLEKLAEAGHEVDNCDLYAEDFDPRLAREERLACHDERLNIEPVRQHVERLQRAEALVLSCPVWNFGNPAIPKGCFDRVFLPGVSFRLVEGRVRPSLHHIKKVAVVTTHGAPRWRVFVLGDPPRKLVQRVIRAQVRPGAPVHCLAHCDKNRSTPQSRAQFMAKVGRTMDGF